MRYAIWNKKDDIITPIGEVLSAAEWIARYPVAKLNNITVVCGAGEINGSFFGTLGQMKELYESKGADFKDCETDEDILRIIEAFEDNLNAPSKEATAEERIAAAIEYQVLSTLPDAHEEE